MNITADRLAASEAPKASRVLARAFADDPVLGHFLHDPVRREVAFPAFFQAALTEALPLGHVYAIRIDHRLAGVAAWFPPDPPEPDARTVAQVERLRDVVRSTFPDTTPALFEGFAAMERLHPSTAYWYLSFVAIDPDLQSGGFGAQLLAPVLALADETNTMCYLETPFLRTHAFYQRLGFALGREVSPFVGAPPIWTFARPPLPIV